jgi:hypothetical protein
MNIRPVLAVPPPTKPLALSTAGSRITVSTNLASFFCIAWNDVSWSAWIAPVSLPVSCWGKNPFGIFA